MSVLGSEDLQVRFCQDPACERGVVFPPLGFLVVGGSLGDGGGFSLCRSDEIRFLRVQVRFRFPIERDLDSCDGKRKRKLSTSIRHSSTTTSTCTCVERDGNQGHNASMHEGWCASGKGCGKMEGKEETHDARMQTCASLCPR